MTTFAQRSQVGAGGVAELKVRLTEFGFTVFEIGQETWLPSSLHEKIRHEHADLMIRAIRYMPDLVALAANFPWSYWESKVNVTPGTPNFTIEKACYDEQMARQAKGERVVVAFKDVDGAWSANWIERLVVLRDMSEQRQDARGSRTPYLLIRKTCAVPFAEFVLGRWR